MHTPRPHRALGGSAALVAVLLAACAPAHRFPLTEPLREAPDRQHVDEKPKDTYSPPTWDAVDQTLFAPISRVLSVDVPGRAANANAWDEVPDSSWFTNRIEGLDPDAIAQGPCPEEPVPSGTWTVISAKPDGADPGFVMEADGQRYVVKLDRASNPERGTTADVVSSRFYWAAGYDVPCNRIVYFDPDDLVIADDAEAEDKFGKDQPLTREMLDEVLERALLTEDGTYRANASLFLDGAPIGPWHYEGRKRDDPNDTIRHEDRREVRGSRLLGAWFDHIDARSQNTLMMFKETEDGRQYVQHHVVDFGDNFGFDWRYKTLSRRLGHQTGFHVGTMLVDWLSLGTIAHPWDRPYVNERAPMFRDYDTEHFDPDGWRAGYANPAFNAMDDADGAWMARILARFDDATVEALVREGELTNPSDEAELIRVIKGRRDMLLNEYLRRVSPLGRFSVEERRGVPGAGICFEDVAAQVGVHQAGGYTARGYYQHDDHAQWRQVLTPDDQHRMCLDLSVTPRLDVAPETPADDPSRYMVVNLEVDAPDVKGKPLPPARLYLYDLGDDGFALVGIDRPTRALARRSVFVPSSHRPGEDAVWVPRVALAPLYGVHEFLIRKPIGGIATAWEKHNVSAHVQRALTFGSHGLVGIMPTFFLDFGARPSVGATAFINMGRRARFTHHFGYGGPGWLSVSARQRIRLGSVKGKDAREFPEQGNRAWDDSQIFFGFRYHRQPDYLFMGMAQDHVDFQTWFADRTIGGDVGAELRFGTLDGIRIRGVVEHHALGPGRRGRGRPRASIEDIFDVTNPKVVPGWGDYLLGAVETTLNLDSRKERPAPGSGVGVQLQADLGVNLETRRSGFLRWGGRTSAWLDLSRGGNRVLSIHQDIRIVTPLDDEPIPFPEQIALGGLVGMRGFRQGTLRGMSSFVTTIEYEWPVWAYLDAFIFTEVGNTFGQYLEGFHPGELRLSTGTGFRTTIDRDVGFVAMVGFGTTPFNDDRFRIDNVRLTVGFDRSF